MPEPLKLKVSGGQPSPPETPINLGGKPAEQPPLPPKADSILGARPK